MGRRTSKKLNFFEVSFSVDDEKRAISSVGDYEDLLWVHVRNYAVILLGPGDEVRTSLKLTHCGYCRATTVGSFLVYPGAAVSVINHCVAC